MRKVLGFFATNLEILALFVLSHIVALAGFVLLVCFAGMFVPVNVLLANAPIVYLLPNILSMLFFANIICSLNDRVFKLKRLTINLYFILDAIILAIIFTVLIVMAIVFFARHPDILKTIGTVAAFPLVLLMLFSHGTALFMLPGILGFVLLVIVILLFLPFILYAEFAISYNIVFHHRKHKAEHKKRNIILFILFVAFLVFSSLVPYTAKAKKIKKDAEGKPSYLEELQLKMFEDLSFDEIPADDETYDKLIDFLKMQKFDFNTMRDGKTLLIHVIEKERSLSIIRKTIEAGADVNKPDDRGLSPLYYAGKRKDSEECCKLLIDFGAISTSESQL